MSFKIKIDKADQVFSKYIRTRDSWTCQRCHKRFEEGSQGLHCSHFFGRAKESTRFFPDNCDSLCMGCHQHWGSTDREGYRDFKIRQLGEKGFLLLRLEANKYQKKRSQDGVVDSQATFEKFRGRKQIKCSGLDTIIVQP